MRTIAILNENKNACANAAEIAKNLTSQSVADNICIFTYWKEQLKDVPESIQVEQLPDGLDNRPKRKNYVTKFFKDKSITGHLHQLEDYIELLKSPTLFLTDIEKMMDVYDLNNWCGTVTDTCNLVYSKYNPRLDIAIDDPKYLNLGISNAVFCSHSNVQWMIMNLDKADDNELYFNDTFKIDMFFIIEFLARRRNTHQGSLYFMNQYYTCSSEAGLYRFKKGIEREKADYDENAQMQKEDLMFKQLNVNYAPDNNVDMVLERLYEKLQQKA